MEISINQVPAVMQALDNAIMDGKPWLAVSQSIQNLSAGDLHFFNSRQEALSFQEYNEANKRGIILSPTVESKAMIDAVARTEHEKEQPGNTVTIYLDMLEGDYVYNQQVEDWHALQMDIDEYDWKRVSYDPGQKEFDGVMSQIKYNRLEWLVEAVAAFAVSVEWARSEVAHTLNMYWKDTPMEKHIDPVLLGQYGEKAQSIVNNKKETMNAENLEYLQKQLLYAGFGEGLQTQLERKLKEGLPEFQLNASHEFGKDKMEAVLYFSRSKQEGSDKYFFNKYDATLNNAHGSFQQMFFINNKGQSITFKEACNLLNGRSVYKELTPKEGARYKAWVKLDFGKRDEHGNAKLNIFNEKYGFSLKEALGRIPLKELKDPEKMAALFTALEGGNMAKATLIKSDREMEVQLAADPKFKTVKMFDMEGVKLYVPAQKQEEQYGKAPVDEKREAEGKVLEVGQPVDPAKQQEKAPDKGAVQGESVATDNKTQGPKKDRPLLEKNNVNKGKGKKIA